MSSEKSGIDIKRTKKICIIMMICLDPICNPSWNRINTNNNSTIINAVGNRSVDVSSIIALIIFFGVIIYSA